MQRDDLVGRGLPSPPVAAGLADVARSLRMCCSRVDSVSTKPRFPSVSTVWPTTRPGIRDRAILYMGFAGAGYGIMWNTRYVKAKKLPEPKEWSDLAKPVYHNHVGMSAPSRSGTTHLVNLLATDQPVGKLRGRLHQLPAGVPVAVHPEDGSFIPRIQDIEQVIGSYTKAVILNSPNNPSGAVYDDDGWRWAVGDEPASGEIASAPSFARIAFDHERTPVGPSVGQRASDFWRFADRELGTGLGALTPPPDRRRPWDGITDATPRP